MAHKTSRPTILSSQGGFSSSPHIIARDRFFYVPTEPQTAQTPVDTAVAAETSRQSTAVKVAEKHRTSPEVSVSISVSYGAKGCPAPGSFFNVEAVVGGDDPRSFSARWFTALLVGCESAAQRRRRSNAERQRRFKSRHPEQTRAVNALNAAVRKGIVQRKPCQQCGATEKVEGHHADYSRPLDVTWLCKPCHEGSHAHKFHGNSYVAADGSRREATR